MTVRTIIRKLSTGAGPGLVLASTLLVSGCGGQRAGEPQSQSTLQEKSGAGPQQAGAEQVNARQKLGAHTQTTRLEFRTQPKQVTAGQPAIWTLKVLDAASGDAVKKFQIVNEQFMHVIVVSRDLSWLAHARPEYKDRGLFITSVTLPRAGEYKLYADYTPGEGPREVAQHEVKAAGSNGDPAIAPAKASSLPVDSIDKNGWITKRVVAVPEGEAGEPVAQDGPTYEVALMPMPAKLPAGQDVILHFQIRNAEGEPVKDLQPYLGAPGYAVVLSADTDIYLYAHPNDGPTADEIGGPDVMFRTRFPVPGRYKVWSTFMHNGKIITAPFVVKVEGTAPAE
jgi:hypothetical protein